MVLASAPRQAAAPRPVRSTTVVIVSSGRVVCPATLSAIVRALFVFNGLSVICTRYAPGCQPGRISARAVCNSIRCIRALLDKNFDQLQRGRVSPMQVPFANKRAIAVSAAFGVELLGDRHERNTV